MNPQPTVRSGSGLKSAPPISHPMAFRRGHVVSQLESSSGAPLITVQAPLGFGKTTVLSFLADAEGPSARWVNLDEADSAPDVFVGSVVSAIYGWPVAPPSGITDVREAARWVVGAIEEQSVTIVVLDDFEAVAESELTSALVEAVCERLPPYVRIAVACEARPEFVKRARLRQMVVELDAADLRFDAEDVARYIREVHRYDLGDDAAASVARRSGGCAALVNLVGQLSHDLPGYLRLDVDALPLGPGEEHLTLLFREVLSRGGHSPARAARELLRGATGRPGGATPADTLLEFLGDRHCLAQTYRGETPVIVPHMLLGRLAPRL